MRACAVAESNGVAAVAIVSTGFVAQARAIAKALRIAHVPLAVYPGTIPNDALETVRAKAEHDVAPAVLAGLTERVDGAAEPEAREPAAREIVFSGGIDEIQEHFGERLWTDGLPIVPPTIGRVERFLEQCDRDPAEVLGLLDPDHRDATVWSVAVNGVMAGCRPEYMPILIAIVEAIADPVFRLQDAGSTPGWEPLALVSGPMVERLGFNSGPGLMRVGPRANTSIGRFVRLYMRNIAGLRTPPGTTDKGSIGMTFNVALAEDDAALARIGWPPTRVEQGFEYEDDVVTLQSVYLASQPVYSGGADARPHLEALAHILGSACGPWVATAVQWHAWHPLLLLSPSVAEVLAGQGLTKDDVRLHLFEHAKVEARWLEVWPHHYGAPYADLRNLIAAGEAPAAYAESDDPKRLVPALLRPEWTTIVVAGDPGRNQSRFYVNNHVQGAPVSRRVRWRE